MNDFNFISLFLEDMDMTFVCAFLYFGKLHKSMLFRIHSNTRMLAVEISSIVLAMLETGSYSRCVPALSHVSFCFVGLAYRQHFLGIWFFILFVSVVVACTCTLRVQVHELDIPCLPILGEIL
jgi:hypothetical protein